MTSPDRHIEVLTDDIQEAIRLLDQVDNYGIRVQMGSEWCEAVDRLLAKYGEDDADNTEDDEPDDTVVGDDHV